MADADGPPGSDQQEEGGLQAGLNISGTSDKEKHVFKAPAPRQSLLGLDRLAAQKRAEQAKHGSVLGKRPLLSLGDDDEGAAGEEPAAAAGGPSTSGPDPGSTAPREHRHYRGQRIETPSHPGGVSERARETAAERERRHREREREGLYASTAGGERERRDGGRDRRDERYRRDWRDDRYGRDERHGARPAGGSEPRGGCRRAGRDGAE